MGGVANTVSGNCSKSLCECGEIKNVWVGVATCEAPSVTTHRTGLRCPGSGT